MISDIIFAIITSVISLLLWPLLLTFTLVNEIVRLIIGQILLPKGYEFNPDIAGNFLWSHEFNARMSIFALYSSGDADISKDVTRFKEKVLKRREPNGTLCYGGLKKMQVVKYGYGCLKDESSTFKLQNHVKLYDSSKPKNGDYFTEEELTRVILPQYLSKNMDESKPQWEWLVFPRVKRENGSINSLRIFRFDHRYLDGPSTAVLVTECMFDPWDSNGAPWVFNPRKCPPDTWWQIFTKLWALLQLPLLIILGTGAFSEKVNHPFAVWDNKGTKVFSNTQSLDKNAVTIPKNMKFTTALATALGPILYKTWQQRHPGQNIPSESVNVATFHGMSRDTSMINRFSFTGTAIPVNGTRKVVEFMEDITIYFAFMHIQWMGRLPIALIKKLVGPSDTTVVLNSLPYLRKCGSIHGSKVEEVVSWDILYTPVGLDLTIYGYGGRLYVTAFSVEDCLSYEQLNQFVKDYVKEIQAK